MSYRAQKSNFEKLVDRHEKSNGIINIIHARVIFHLVMWSNIPMKIVSTTYIIRVGYLWY